MLFWFPLQRGWPESEIGKSTPDLWNEASLVETTKVDQLLGAQGTVRVCSFSLFFQGYVLFWHIFLFSLTLNLTTWAHQGGRVSVCGTCVHVSVHTCVCVHKCECVLVKVKVAQSCPLCDPMCYISTWNSPGQNTGVGGLSLIQGIFPTQGLNPGLPHCRWILYQLSHKGSPRLWEWVAYPFCSRSSQPRNRTGVFCIESGFFTNWAIRQDPGVLVLTHYFCHHCRQCSGSRCKEIESLRVTVGHSFGMNRTGC